MSDIVLPFFLGVLSSVLCWLAAGGANLGCAFGIILFAALLVPPLTLNVPILPRGAVSAGSVVAGIVAPWLAAPFTGDVSISECASVVAILFAFALAVSALACAAHAMRLPVSVQSAIVLLLALAWLTWPVWLSPSLTGAHAELVVQWLTPAHPLLAANSAMIRFGSWANDYPLAYQRLTNLNQDVPYQLPASIWPCVLVHVVAAMSLSAGLFLARGLRRRLNLG